MAAFGRTRSAPLRVPAHPRRVTLSAILQSPNKSKKLCRAVGAGTLGPALNHENYETNPKQFLWIVFNCNWFGRFWLFFPLAKRTQKSLDRSPKSAKTPAKPHIVKPRQA
jgi:hypothetical protein